MGQRKKLWWIVILVACLVLFGCDTASTVAQDQGTPTPPAPTATPTPTPSLTTNAEIINYAKSVINGIAVNLGGSITHVDSTGGLHVVEYISGKDLLDNSQAKSDVIYDSFAIEHAIWTSRLRGVESVVYVNVQSDLQDQYGKQTRGDIGRVVLSRQTEQKFDWGNLFAQPAWDNHDYDSQWLLPDIANS